MRLTIRNDDDEADLVISWTDPDDGRRVDVLKPGWDLQVVFDGTFKAEAIIEHQVEEECPTT